MLPAVSPTSRKVGLAPSRHQPPQLIRTGALRYYGTGNGVRRQPSWEVTPEAEPTLTPFLCCMQISLKTPVLKMFHKNKLRTCHAAVKTIKEC